jgi:hypothetical protein
MSSSQNRCAKPVIFASHFNEILCVQPSAQKYFSSVFQKIMFLSAHPASLGGAARDRHGRWKQDAVDVKMFSALMRADESSFTDGEGVWS